jgi:hypothetical protein
MKGRECDQKICPIEREWPPLPSCWGFPGIIDIPSDFYIKIHSASTTIENIVFSSVHFFITSGTKYRLQSPFYKFIY